MPVIQLVHPNALPNAAPAVLDRNQRPTQDTRAVQAGVERLGRSTRKPELPAQLAAPAAALGAIGDAIARTGNIFGAVEQKRHEAETYNQVNEAEALLELRRLEFNEGLEKERPERFKELWGKHSANVAKEIAALPLNPEAREKVRLTTDFWTKANAARVGALGTKVTFDRARQGSELEIENAIQKQNLDEMRGAMDFAEKQGWQHEFKREYFERKFKQVGEAQKLKAESERFDASLNSAIAIASGKSEFETLAMLDQGVFGEHKPEDKERLRSAIHRTARGRAAEAADFLAEGIVAPEGGLIGKIKTEADVERFAADNPQLSRQVVEAAKKDLGRYADGKLRESQEEDRRVNGLRNFVELRHAVDAYDKKDDPEGVNGYMLQQEIYSRVPNPHSGLLRRDLWLKLSAKPAAVTPPDAVRQFIHESIKDNFQTPTEQYRDDGKDKTRPVTDPKKLAPYREAEYKVREKMEQWIKLHPEQAKDVEAARKKLLEVLPEGARVKMGGALNRVGGLTPQAAVARPAKTIAATASKVGSSLVQIYGGRVEQWADRDIRGRPGVKSAHATGEALDYYPPTPEAGSQIALVMADAKKAKRVIYSGKVWTPKDGWKEYKGVHAHEDHIHIEPL